MKESINGNNILSINLSQRKREIMGLSKEVTIHVGIASPTSNRLFVSKQEQQARLAAGGVLTNIQSV